MTNGIDHDIVNELTDPAILTPLAKITKDIKEASRILTDDEARFLVDLYYQMQDQRIQGKNQVRALDEVGEPNEVLQFFGRQFEIMEKQVKATLKVYAQSKVVGQWAMSLTGIAEVMTAGFLAHISIVPWRCKLKTIPGETQCSQRKPHTEAGCGPETINTASAIYRYAGLDPTVKWEKKSKRPWNAKLKRLTWLLGESFVKFSNFDGNPYGPMYRARKEYESAKNARLEYKEQAELALTTKKIGKETEAYKWLIQGILPPAQIHRRACRWTTKIFLSHYHQVLYFSTYGKMPPAPFAIARLGHADEIPIPNRHMVPGLDEAIRARVIEPYVRKEEPNDLLAG